MTIAELESEWVAVYGAARTAEDKVSSLERQIREAKEFASRAWSIEASKREALYSALKSTIPLKK